MKYFIAFLSYKNFFNLKLAGYKLLKFPVFSRKTESKNPGDKLIIYIGSGKLLIPGIFRG